MKKRNLIHWAFILPLIVVILFSCNTKETTRKEVIKKTTDERGLISVVYIDGPDTLAYDYLTQREYNDIFHPTLNPVRFFKTGDTLLPTYACIDTLIVIDAIGLNKGMGLIEQGIIDASDSQIDSVLHKNCKPYK